MEQHKLLRVENLILHFSTDHGVVQAVDGVNFELDYNKAVVVLGESGCGKTSLAKAMLRLLPRNVLTYSGKVYVEGHDVMALDDEEFRKFATTHKISVVALSEQTAARVAA